MSEAWGATIGGPVLLALVLAASGALKVREHPSTVSAFRQLLLPDALVRYGAARALPWAELLLAAGLVLAGGRLGLVVAIAAAVLVVAYVGLVVRALGFDHPVTCSCFGKLGLGPITGWSLVRNLVLLLVAVVAVLDLARHPEPVVARIDGGDAGWLVALLVAAVLGGLVAHRPGPGTPAPRPPAPEQAAEPEEYVRGPIPYVELRRHDDEDVVVSLHQLVRERPALLVLASLTCDSCLQTLGDLPAFADQNPELDVYGVLGARDLAARSADVPPGVRVLVDPAGAFGDAFTHDVPTAVLLGADQLIAGGPVTGAEAVAEFCEEIAASLEELRSDQEPDGVHQLS